MPRNTILIGCRLPNGITLSHPKDRDVKVTLNGVSASKIIGATFNTTEVDAEFWTDYQAANLDYAPLQNGAIFVAHDPASAHDMARDLEKVKTGLEPVPQDSNGVTVADKA